MFKLREEGVYADLADHTQSVSKQVREGQLMQYNYMVIVGAQERMTGTVTYRTRDSKPTEAAAEAAAVAPGAAKGAGQGKKGQRGGKGATVAEAAPATTGSAEAQVTAEPAALASPAVPDQRPSMSIADFVAKLAEEIKAFQ